jgi:hypothetical protein
MFYVFEGMVFIHSIAIGLHPMLIYIALSGLLDLLRFCFKCFDIEKP